MGSSNGNSWKQISFFIGALSYEGEYLQNNNQIIVDVKNLNNESLNEFNFEIIVEITKQYKKWNWMILTYIGLKKISTTIKK